MSCLSSDLISLRRRRSQFALPMVLALLLLPGCVVQAIHDDLAATRAGVERIAELAPALQQTNAALDSSNAQLERLYSELSSTHNSLEFALARLDTTNEHMRESVQRLSHLDPMMASLKSLDESLAALRKLVDSIASSVPLLGLTKDNSPEEVALHLAETEPHENRRARQSQDP